MILLAQCINTLVPCVIPSLMTFVSVNHMAHYKYINLLEQSRELIACSKLMWPLPIIVNRKLQNIEVCTAVHIVIVCPQTPPILLPILSHLY